MLARQVTANRLAGAVGRDPRRGVAADRDQLDRRHAAPAIHVPARLPATKIGMLRARMRLLALEDRRAQAVVELGRFRQVVGHDRRREKSR